MIPIKSVFIATLLFGMTVTQSVSGAPQESEANTVGGAENPSAVTETTNALESPTPEPQISNPKSAESVSEFALTKGATW